MKIALNNQPINSIRPANIFKNRQPVSYISFTGENPSVIGKSKFFEPVKKFFKPLTNTCTSIKNNIIDLIAKGYAKLLKTAIADKIISKTETNKIKVVKHISAFIGLIISGLYIHKTLSNDKLDPQKKTTLALNQGIVSLTATVLGYTVDGLAGKQIDKLIRKYSAANMGDESLTTLRKGVKAASSIMIFGLMYRYIAPVVVTPIANHIGNKIQAKKEAELALNKKA